MIRTDEELELTRTQLARVERALQSIRREVLPASEARFLLMSESYVSQLLELRAQIDAYLGIDIAFESQAAVAIGLEGPTVKLGETAAGVMTRTLDMFRRGLQAIVEVGTNDSGRARFAGRRKKWIEQLCDLPLLAVRPGSVRVLLGEPESSGLFTKEDHEILKNGLELLFIGLKWAADDSAPEIAPTSSVREVWPTLLAVIRSLVPPRNGVVEAVTFGGTYVGSVRPLRLTGNARGRLKNAIEALAAEVQHTEVRGIIREVDLDDRTFILRERTDGLPALECEYAESVEPEVKAYLDEAVVVTGFLRTSSKNKRVSLEVESIESDADAIQ